LITGGQLVISAGCVIDGVIETGAGMIEVVNGGILEDTMFFGCEDWVAAATDSENESYSFLRPFGDIDR